MYRMCSLDHRAFTAPTGRVGMLRENRSVHHGAHEGVMREWASRPEAGQNDTNGSACPGVKDSQGS
jgi:hypothetical protein